MSDGAFVDDIKNALDKYSRRKIEDSTWNSMKNNLIFHAGAYDDLSSFVELEKKNNKY